MIEDEQTTVPAVTYFGLGLHEQRDRYLVDEWFFYTGDLSKETQDKRERKQEVIATVVDRYTFIAPHAAAHVQSEDGKLFEAIADESDDDAALAELEDAGEL